MVWLHAPIVMRDQPSEQLATDIAEHQKIGAHPDGLGVAHDLSHILTTTQTGARLSNPIFPDIGPFHLMTESEATSKDAVVRFANSLRMSWVR